MFSKITNLISGDKFIKNNIISFVGAMIIAVLNYAYHPILSRMLSVDEFGEVQALISIFLQLSIMLGIFGNIVINLTVNSTQESDKSSIINQLYKIAFVSSLVLTGSIILFTPILNNFLQFESTFSLWILAISFPMSISFTFRMFFLQGKSDFTKKSLVGILFAFLRVFFAVILIWLGFAVFGAMASITIATLLSLIYVYYLTKNNLKLSLKQKVIWNKKLLKEFKFGGLVLIATSFVTFLYTADMIYVKHFFTPEQAGFYGGITIIARTVFFVTGSVGAVLIASIKIKNSFKQNFKILKKGFLIFLLLGGSCTAVFAIFPEFVINIMIGSRYVDYAYLLPKMSFLLFFASMINLVTMFFLALRKFIIIYVALISAIFINLIIWLNHATMSSIVNGFLMGAVFALALFACALFIESKK